MARNETKSNRSRLFTLVMPKALLDRLQLGSKLTDLDKSKFVRHAVREKLDRHEVPTLDTN